MIPLDGGQWTDVDTLLLGALALSGATGQPFEIADVGRIAGKPGVSPLQLTAIKAMARLCAARVQGDSLQAEGVRFEPTAPPRARDLLVDIGETTGRPAADSVVPLMECLLPVLARSGETSLVRFRGVNASPAAPSAFWLRETLLPMLEPLDIHAAAEVEHWGWYPDGGGMATLAVDGEAGTGGTFVWEERGDPIEMWALVALSPRSNRRTGQAMVRAAQAALADEPLPHLNVESARVRSPGPGSGLFLSVQFEHALAGFDGVSHRGSQPEQLVEGTIAEFSSFFWSDAAFEPALARAMMLPLALGAHRATFTTSALTLPMRVLADLLPRFLPCTVRLDSHPRGGQVTIAPAAPP